MFDFSEIFTHVRGVIGASFGTIKKGVYVFVCFLYAKNRVFWPKKENGKKILKFSLVGHTRGWRRTYTQNFTRLRLIV